MQFKKVALLTSSGTISFFKYYRETNGAAGKGAKWLLHNFYNWNFEQMYKVAEFYHTGRCLKCNRELTDATSIEYGLGPICRAN